MNSENEYNINLIKSQLGMASNLKSLSAAASAAPGSGSAPAADAKRWKASLDFQSMFLGQMYKAMRKSTMGSEITEMSSGREIFTEMLDQEYARMDAKNPLVSGSQGMERAVSGISNSLAAQVYRTLLRQEGQPADGKAPIPSSLSAASAASAGMAKVLGGRKQGGKALQTPTLSDAVLDPIVDAAAKTYGVARNLIRSVIGQESAGKHLAVSAAGAKGLMQLMDTTAGDLGVRNVFNPRENVMAGTRYLKNMLERFGGDEKLALAAYNAGPGTVDRFGGMPPYAETKDYVGKVLKAKAAMDEKDMKDGAMRAPAGKE